MNKRLVVRQNSYKDCGVSCLVSIMRYYNVDPPYEEVAYYLRLNKDGTNAYNIINGSLNYGFDGYGCHYSYEEIINNKVNFPIICHTLKNNLYHFIVIYNVNKKYLEVMDPSKGMVKLKKDDFKKIYLNTSIVIYPVKKIENINIHKSLNKYCFTYLNNIKKEIIFSIILSLIIVLLNLVINYYLTYLIDTNYNYNLLILITLFFINISIFKNIFTFIRNKILIKIENKIIKNINIDVIRKLFNLPYLFFKNKSTGEIESRLNDLEVFREIVSKNIVDSLLNILFVICSFIILLLINKELLLITIIDILLYYLITLLFKPIINNNIEDISIYESDYKKYLTECIYGYETNKNINIINNIIKRIEIKYISLIDKTNKYNSNKQKDIVIKNILGDLLYILLMFSEVYLLKNKLLTIGNLILFNTTILYFRDSLKNIIDLNYNSLYYKNTYKRINDLFVVEKKKEEINIYDINKDIIINNLSYSIDGLHNIFDNISLVIKNKSKYLIYGNSGSGKSTLIKIILKYLNDYSGEIYLGNINIKDICRDNVSYNFTYVSQNSYINNDTFKNNIIYDRQIDNNTYEEIINICNLKSLRDSKKLRDNFMIEEDGFNISGGEKQKIILARSLLKHFNYLVLDEALSEVDENEEIDIINKIFKKYEEKTIVYISHKKRIIDLFDEKYKLERRNKSE